MAEVAISLPFSITSFGSIATTSDQKKIWSDRVLSVLGTFLRERVMRPSFGTLIPYALFETGDSAIAEIRSEVQAAFNTQLPLLTLTSTDVTYDSYSNIITVSVLYGLPNQEETTTSIALVYIDGTNPPYEESL